MSLKTIYAKTGTTAGIPTGETAVVGMNANRIPAANGDDAKSLTFYQGLHTEEPIEVHFTKVAQDGRFYVEITFDGTNYSSCAFYDGTTGNLVAGTMTLAASIRMVVKPILNARIMGMRCGFFLAGADATAECVIRIREGR